MGRCSSNTGFIQVFSFRGLPWLPWPIEDNVSDTIIHFISSKYDTNEFYGQTPGKCQLDSFRLLSSLIPWDCADNVAKPRCAVQGRIRVELNLRGRSSDRVNEVERMRTQVHAFTDIPMWHSL